MSGHRNKLAFAALATCLIALSGAPASAGVSLVVGTANNGNCYPFKCNDTGITSGESIDYEQIYSQNAFTGPITISTLNFFNYTGYNATAPVIDGDYLITLSTTTSPLGSGYPISLSNTETFFNGALGGETGNLTITGTPYTYNPSDGNLVMEVVATNQAGIYNYTTNGYFNSDSTGSSTTRAYDLLGGEYAGAYNDNIGLVTGFNAVPEPATWAFMLIGVGGVGAAMRKIARGSRNASSAIA
jgi:hypothetical protein